MTSLLLALALAHAHETPAHVQALRERVDWQVVGDEAVGWLSDYLAIDTVAPPGNERDGAVFLQGILEAEGIQTRLIEHGENRASLIGWLRGDGTAPPLCLLSHIDVVPSELEHWTHGPLSGEVVDGQIWGRGALDMKGMGIVELGAMVQLARLKAPLARDVVLLAVADEELDGLGIRTLVDQHWGEIGCSHLINEGGIGIRDALVQGQTVHAISVAERGVLWLRLIAEGVVGHGSTIAEGEAPARLLEAMERVERRYRPKPHIHPAFYRLFRRVGEHHGGLVGALIKTPSGVRTFVKPRLLAEGATAAALTDTLHLTGMGGASSVNVVPSEVWAQYDGRLLPGTDPQVQLARLQALIADLPGVRWEVLDARAGNESPMDDPFFDRIAHYAEEDRADAAAGPVLSVGFTDSIFVRPLGVHAYGYVPFIVTQDEAKTMHGHDERVSVDNVREGVRRMFSIVLDFAGRVELPAGL
jgi:acetylornithine deacetylase/succinyl-diaminopimelate desuccinylase-like protein